MTISVYVIDRGRKYLYLRYIDPETGAAVERSSKKTTEKEALKEAARWEKDIASGAFARKRMGDWELFRDRYEKEWLSGLKESSRGEAITILEKYEDFCREGLGREPSVDILKSQLSKFVAWMRDQKRGDGERLMGETRIAGVLRHFKSMLQWGVSNGLVHSLPVFPTVQRAERSGVTPMKGRPISDAEFERMLGHAPTECDFMGTPEERVFYLKGMWLSGLRLEESLDLWWDRPDRMCIQFIDGIPLLKVQAAIEKGNRNRLLPLTPDFEDFLLAVPEAQRAGRVFFGHVPKAPNKDSVSRLVTRCGKSAGVVVSERPLKYASAHDLRRSFGSRWARRVAPIVLKQLMRHSSIQTTERYYIELDAFETRDSLRRLVTDFGDTSNLGTCPRIP